ncbi:sugar ABC transporter permease [Bacillus altitudinis]|uniref:DUF6677 family protein n=1 Tax=Bacillus TaxID=1386 RepID=UPI00247E56CB|nr:MULTISPECIES: DUF6677 family protein [Bacillus]MDH6599087.1 TM2 domain-containing membrane protein YozV [Bacillus aerius]WHF26999.1 sugar ABC transporter permease [Bacillus altitudinis]
MKNVWIAGLLSLLMPGIGHLYLGKVLKGVVLIILNIVFITTMSTLLGLLFFLANWIYAIINSVRMVRFINYKS